MPTKTTNQADEQAQAQAAADEKARKAQEKADEKARQDAARVEAKAAKEQERIQAEATKAAIDLASLVGTGTDGAITLADVRQAAKAKRAEERAARPRKAPMTLSQRRAIVKLHEDGPQVAKTDFNTLPFDYLVKVGLAAREDVTIQEEYIAKEEQDVEVPEAERVEGGPTTKKVKVTITKTRDVVKPQYSLTDAGKARAPEINRKWKTWKPDSAVASAPSGVATQDPEPVA